MVGPYCSRCGGPTEPTGAHEARCRRCAHVAYDDPKPCVGAIIARGDSILLSLRARDPARGSWDLLGGFLAFGEHPVDGLRRELREETGCDATIGQLVHIAMGSYDDRSTLNLIFEATLDGDPRPSEESIELAWHHVDTLPSMAFPHERRALEWWKVRRGQPALGEPVRSEDRRR